MNKLAETFMGSATAALKKNMHPSALGKTIKDSVIPAKGGGLPGAIGGAFTAANTIGSVHGIASEYKDRVEGAGQKAEEEAPGNRWNPLTFAKRKMIAGKEREGAKDQVFNRVGETGVKLVGGAAQAAVHGAIDAGLASTVAATGGLSAPAALASSVAIGAGLNATMGKATNTAAEKFGPSVGKFIRNIGK